MQTYRDQRIVGWIARIGAAGAEHVRARFGMCQSRAYARLHLLVRDGLLEHEQLLDRQPGLYIATGAGLRWVGLTELGLARVSVAGFAHAREVSATAVALRVLVPGWRTLSERELRAAEREGGRAIASVNYVY